MTDRLTRDEELYKISHKIGRYIYGIFIHDRISE